MDECDCESTPQSEYPGPGVVEDDEVVLRLVFLPNQINDDGTIKPTSLSKEEFKRQFAGAAPSRGFSVSRAAHLKPMALETAAQTFQDKDPSRKEVHAYAVRVSNLRALRLPDGTREVCVVDRALQGDAAHAEVWGAHPGRQPSVLKKIRADVAALFTLSSKLTEPSAGAR